MSKLIRDKIPEIVLSKGECSLVTHIAGDEQYTQALREKLQEEVSELLAASEDIGEFADVLEVLYSMGKLSGITPEAMEAARIEKKEKRGGFENKIIWEQ